MDKEHISDYKARLEKELSEFMKLPVTEGSAEAVKSMIECLDAVEHLEHCAGIEDDAHTSERLTDSELRAWLQRMDNADGSTGQHWTEDQTASIAAAIGVTFDHVTAEEFCAAMNMMYSDYFPVGVKYGVDRPEFYADLAKAFLFDKDGPAPSEKLAEYYHKVVK